MRRRIETMRLEYLDQVLCIEQASFKSPWPTASFAAEIQHPWSWFKVIGPARKTGGLSRVDGFIICWVILSDMHLLNLAITPEYRRQGLASTMLTDALTNFARDGGGYVSLEVRPSNVAAQELYRSFGFKVVGRRKQYYRSDNEDAIIMALEVGEELQQGRKGARN
jgi:ribosomal-protein-alanine N-acetyltransferase